MGNASTALSPAEVRHLLRRTGFGAPAKEAQRILDRFPTRGEAAEYLLKFRAAGFQPRGKDISDRQNSWIRYMLRGRRPLQEKLVLFWHDHFATNFATVRDEKMMGRQNQLLRKNCKGNFKDLVKEINRDPAMMDFLDTVRNRKQNPNENYARELKELFTLGVFDFAGNETYTQEDIVQIARAFTGWDEDKGKPVFRENRHDFNAEYEAERGPKVIFQSTGGFGPGGRDFASAGEGAVEIDTVTDIIFDHTDSDGMNTVARRTARRLLEYFAHGGFAIADGTTAPVVDAVVAASGFDTNWDVEGLLFEIFCHDAFYETAAVAPWTGAVAKSVKWPVDYVVTTMRTLGVNPKGKDTFIDGPGGRDVRRYMEDMGQELFEPPSVFGWDWETSWITSTTMLERARFARDLVRADGRGSRGFRPERLIDIDETAPEAVVDAVLAVLGLTEHVTNGQRQYLVDYLNRGDPGRVLDLAETDRERLKGLFIVAIQSPMFQLQ